MGGDAGGLIMSKYTDLWIVDDQIKLDAAGIPELIHDRDVIEQDVRHALRESGLLEQLVGERSVQIKKLILKKIRILVESDARILPGSSAISAVNKQTFSISADSEFGPVVLGARQ